MSRTKVVKDGFSFRTVLVRSPEDRDPRRFRGVYGTEWSQSAIGAIEDGEKFLRGQMLRGRTFAEAAANLDDLRKWRRAEILKAKARRTFEAATEYALRKDGKIRVLRAEDRAEYLRLHRSIWEHETAAAKRGAWTCECDICAQWEGRLRELNDEGDRKSAADKRRQRLHRGRG